MLNNILYIKARIKAASKAMGAMNFI